MALPESEYGLTGFANQRGIEEILIFAVWIGHIGGLANFAFMVILAVDIDVVPVQGCGRKWIEGGHVALRVFLIEEVFVDFVECKFLLLLDGNTIIQHVPGEFLSVDKDDTAMAIAGC